MVGVTGTGSRTPAAASSHGKSGMVSIPPPVLLGIVLERNRELRIIISIALDFPTGLLPIYRVYPTSLDVYSFPAPSQQARPSFQILPQAGDSHSHCCER